MVIQQLMHALVEVMDEIYVSLDDGNFALGVF